MSNFKDLTNKEFDRLTVKNIVYERDINGCIQWDCLCICGNWKRTTGKNLKQRHVKSCGCLKAELNSKKAKNLNESGRNKHPKAKELLRELCSQFENKQSLDGLIEKVKKFLNCES